MRPRHFGVLSRDNVLYAFFTNKAGSPERIKVSTFDFAELPSADDESWRGWKGDFPNQELIRPEEDWEGASLPLDISELGGETTPRHQLRDPDVFEDTDGRTYLFYSGAGEQGIGLAHSKDLLTWSEPEFLPVMAHEPRAVNAWAPEILKSATKNTKRHKSEIGND